MPVSTEITEHPYEHGVGAPESPEVLLGRSVTGARWTLLLGAVGIPVVYATNVILGRIGPDALGSYSFIILFHLLVLTFLTPGGEQALVRFLPMLPGERRLPLLITYGALSGALTLLFVASIFFYPAPFHNTLLGNQADLAHRLFPILLLLAPVAVATKLMLLVIQASMDIKGMALISKAVPACTLAGILGLAVLHSRGAIQGDMTRPIVGVVLAANAVSLILAVVRAAPTLRKWPLRFRAPSPTGFWSFTVYSLATCSLAFAFANFDLLIISNQLGVRQLGLYKPAQLIGEFVRWLPVVLNQTLYPLFCNLMPQGEYGQLRRTYARVVRYGTVLVGAVGLAVACLASEILAVFGTEFLQNRTTLILLAGAFTLSAVGIVNGSMIMAAGKAGRVLLHWTIGAGLQILIAVWLVPRVGAIGAATGKTVHLVAVTLLDAWVAHAALRLAVPRRVLLLMALNFGLIAFACAYSPVSQLLSVLRGAFLLALYALFVHRLELIHLDDIRFIARSVVGKPDVRALVEE